MSERVSFFVTYSTLTKALYALLFSDEKTLEDYATLAEYLAANDYTYSPEDLTQLIHRAETQLQSQVSYLAHLIYFIMDRSSDWGDAGPDQIKLSFCRNLLHLTADDAVTQSDIFRFFSKVEENIRQHGISELTLEAAQAQYKAFKFFLFGHPFSPYKTTQLNRILKFVGSDLYLQGGYYGESLEFIFGKGRELQMGEYKVVYLEEELIRTPNNIVAMAAVIGNDEIFLREESLRLILRQKWVDAIHYSRSVQMDPSHRIANAIRREVLSLYGLKIVADFEEKKEILLSDMAETVLYHELGHGIVQNHTLPKKEAAIGEASKIFYENILTSVLEFFADTAPIRDGLMGPLHNILKVSREDSQRATRMYYMYFSDTWFFDTPDTYMYVYSELMALFLSHSLVSTGEVDFGSLERDLAYREGLNDASQESFFEFVLRLYLEATRSLDALIREMRFSVEEKEMGFEDLVSHLAEKLCEQDEVKSDELPEHTVPLWMEVMTLVKTDPVLKSRVDAFFASQEAQFLQAVFVFLVGTKAAQKYRFDHRYYVFEHLLRGHLGNE